MPKYIGRTQDVSQGTMRQRAMQDNMNQIAQGLGSVGNAIEGKRALERQEAQTERQMALQEEKQRMADFSTAADLSLRSDTPVTEEMVRDFRTGAHRLGPNEFGPQAPSSLAGVIGGIQEKQAQGKRDAGALRDRTFREKKELKQMDINARKANSKGKGKKLSIFEESMQRKAGADMAEYVAGGGKATADKNINRFKGALDKLKEKGELSGGVSAYLPEFAQDYTSPDMATVRDDIRSAIQGSLKATLGGQFTEKEAEQMFSRAYNPRLSDSENMRRAKIELDALEQMSQNKEGVLAHFKKYGTLANFVPESVAYTPPKTEGSGDIRNLVPVNESMRANYAPTGNPLIDNAQASPQNQEIIIKKKSRMEELRAKQRASKAQGQSGDW